MDSELNKFAQVTELTRNLSGYKAHFLSTVNHLPLILLYYYFIITLLFTILKQDDYF